MAMQNLKREKGNYQKRQTKGKTKKDIERRKNSIKEDCSWLLLNTAFFFFIFILTFNLFYIKHFYGFAFLDFL